MRLLILVIATVLFVHAPPAAAQGTLTVEDRDVFIVFPDRITFNAHVKSTVPVEQIVLEYGVDKRTCGEITAKAFPEFTPGPVIDVNWTWDMLQTGSEPPGAVVWYRWRVTDQNGNTAVTPDKRVTWIDRTYSWQSISRGDLTLHWYAGPPAFAEDMLNTAVDGIERLASLTGVRPQSPIQLYIYGNTQEMQEAMLYEPSWAGGVAFVNNNITIIGIGPGYEEWGKRAIIHELTHLIVGQMTFSCGRNVPTWLDEGIAVYAEGGLDRRSQWTFQQAIASDSLLSLSALTNGFSEHPEVADVSYSQSYSLVNFLIVNYGANNLLALLGTLRDGMTVEQGIRQVYGVGLNELEDRWRAAIGAAPRVPVAAAQTVEPTAIPTLAPMAVAPTGPARAPTATLSPAAATTATAAATPVAAAEQPVAGGATEAAAPVPAAVRQPVSLFDPRVLVAAVIFFFGAGLTGMASWQLFGGRKR
ncbi:MAG: peptidase MA family metallohydrolase [Chloroflexaceae bacterium]|nr:peptidase MA family metallohydrolase [Chloroflexaceae bacterium]